MIGRHTRYLWLVALIAGCGPADGGATTADLTIISTPDLGPAPDAGPGCGFKEDVSQCKPDVNDYQPRAAMSANDQWPACPNDDGTVHLIGPGIPGSAARVAAFEDVGKKLWNNPNPPTMQDFVDARNIYTTMNGLGSRVERRQDLHYPDVIPMNNKTRCSDMGIPAMYPDRCAGPTKLVPIINEAFQLGLAGTEVHVQSAKVEAALLSWLFLSLLSETWTCSFEALDDCDGEWSHFNGAKPRGEAIALATYVKAASPEAYDRMFDAVLAAGCWRQIDVALPAARMDLYTRVQSQIDRASLHGMAAVLKKRLGAMACATGEMKRAHLAFVWGLGQFLVKPAIDKDEARGNTLRAQLQSSLPDLLDVPATQQLLDDLFPCP